jgi:hypothetical protein
MDKFNPLNKLVTVSPSMDSIKAVMDSKALIHGTPLMSCLGLFAHTPASKTQLYYNLESDPLDDEELRKKIDNLMTYAVPPEAEEIWRAEVASMLSSFAVAHHPDNPMVVIDSLSPMRQIEEEEKEKEISRQLRESMAAPGLYSEAIEKNSTFGAQAVENHNAYYNDNILRAFDARVKRPRSERIPHMKRGGYRGRNR